MSVGFLQSPYRIICSKSSIFDETRKKGYWKQLTKQKSQICERLNKRFETSNVNKNGRYILQAFQVSIYIGT